MQRTLPLFLVAVPWWPVVQLQEVGKKKVSLFFLFFSFLKILTFKEVGLFYLNVSKTFIHLNYMNKTA